MDLDSLISDLEKEKGVKSTTEKSVEPEVTSEEDDKEPYTFGPFSLPSGLSEEHFKKDLEYQKKSTDAEVSGLVDLPLEAAKIVGESIHGYAPAGSDVEKGSQYFVDTIAKRNKAVDEKTAADGTDGSRMVGQLLGTGPIGLEKSITERAAAGLGNWFTKGSEVLKARNGLIPAVEQVTPEIAKASKIKSLATNTVKASVRGAEGGAAFGALQPTTDSGGGEERAKNIVAGSTGGAILGAAAYPVLKAAEYGYKGARGVKRFLQSVIGSKSEAESRVGRKLAENATDVDAAQASRKEAVENAKRVNESLKDLGIDSTYKPTDINAAQDIGTASFYKGNLERPEGVNKLTEATINNDNTVAKLVGVSNDPKADKEALGKFASTRVEDTTTRMNKAKSDAISDIKATKDEKLGNVESEKAMAIGKVRSDATKTNTHLQSQIDELESKIGKEPEIDFADKTLTTGVDKGKASAENDAILRQELAAAKKQKNDLYRIADEKGRDVSFDHSPIEETIAKITDRNRAVQNVVESSPAIKELRTMAEDGMNLAEASSVLKKLDHEIESGFNSAVTGGNNVAGANAEYLKPVRSELQRLIEDTTAQVPEGKIALDNYKAYRQKFKTREVPEGQSVSAVEQFNKDAYSGKTPAVPEETMSRFFKPGAEGKYALEEAMTAGADNPNFAKNTEAYILDHFDKAARDIDGNFQVSKYRQELAKYKDTLDAVPELKTKLMDTEQELLANQQKITEGSKSAQDIYNKTIEGHKAGQQAANDLASEQEFIVNDLSKSKKLLAKEDASAAVKDVTQFHAQELGRYKKSFESFVGKEFGDKPSTNLIQSASKNQKLMKKLVDYADKDKSGKSKQALQQMYQEFVEGKTLGLKGGTGVDADVNRVFIKNLLNPAKEERAAMYALYGKDGAKNILEAADILQREAFASERAIGVGAPSGSESKLGALGQIASAKMGGLTLGQSGKLITEILAPLKDREFNRVIARVITDPELAYKLVQVNRAGNKELQRKAAADFSAAIGSRYPIGAGPASEEPEELYEEPTDSETDNDPLLDNLNQDMEKLRDVKSPSDKLGVNTTPFSTGPEPDQVASVIDSAAKKYNVDKKLLTSIANRESKLGQEPSNPNSSASGVFHFIDSTWKEMVKKYGKETGITEAQKDDPNANIIMGALYTRDNSRGLKKYLKRNPSPQEVYMAHMLGLGGAKKLLANYGTVDATSILPEAAKTNKPVFYTKAGKPRTTKELYSYLSDFYNQTRAA